MLFFCFVNFIIGVLRTVMPEKLKKWGFVLENTNFDVDENLPDFYNALKLKDKEWFLTENQY